VVVKIIITPSEAMDKWIWEKLCELKGWNVWCVNEGTMDSDMEIVLTLDEWRQISGALD
jgi:hypothetical protein